MITYIMHKTYLRMNSHPYIHIMKHSYNSTLYMIYNNIYSVIYMEVCLCVHIYTSNTYIWNYIHIYVLAREGAGCGSVGDVPGAWLASAPLSPSLWT